MKDFLSFKSIRALQIAEKLINNHEYILLKDLQEMNACSNKTVYDDIQYLKDNWNEYLDLDLIKNKVRSKKTSVYDLMHMKRNLFHDEIRVKLIINIFFHPYLDMNDYSLKLNYSDSHLRAQVKGANDHLINHNLCIKYDKFKKGYYIEAENRSILIVFMSELIKVSDHEHFLPELSESEMDDFNQFIGEFTNFVPQIQLRELLQLTKVQKTIMTQENLILGQGNTREIIKTKMLKLQETYYNFFVPYIDKFKIKISEEQFGHLLDIFVIASLKQQSAPKRMDNFLNRYDYFYKSFSSENPYMIKVFELALSGLKDQNIDLEIYKSELLFHIYTNITSLREYKVYNIGVYSDIGKAHVDSIILALKKSFSIHNFETYSKNENYDLVITTTNNPDKINLDDTPYIKIADYITHQDIYNVYQKIYLPNQHL